MDVLVAIVLLVPSFVSVAIILLSLLLAVTVFLVVLIAVAVFLVLVFSLGVLYKDSQILDPLLGIATVGFLGPGRSLTGIVVAIILGFLAPLLEITGVDCPILSWLFGVAGVARRVPDRLLGLTAAVAGFLLLDHRLGVVTVRFFV